MMHQRVTGGSPELAVIVVLFDEAPNNYHDLLDSLIGNGLPSRPWQEKTIQSMDFGRAIGGSPFYHYVGSLTVPPCETHVKYYVREDPVFAAHEQMRAFRNILKKTCEPN